MNERLLLFARNGMRVFYSSKLSEQKLKTYQYRCRRRCHIISPTQTLLKPVGVTFDRRLVRIQRSNKTQDDTKRREKNFSRNLLGQRNKKKKTDNAPIVSEIN